MGQTKTTILIADDDRVVQTLMARILGDSDTRMAYASDGPQAVARAREVAPDIIILDVDMPGMTGLEVCTALRRDFLTRHIPILIITGGGSPSTEMHSLNLGADDYVPKPFDTGRLKARVAALLHGSRMRLDLNPLTRLPGNTAIRRESESRLRCGREFTLTYVDIRHFKAFNDRYGFALGDEVIVEATRILREAADAPGVRGFVGHIGGDDFVLITERPPELEPIASLFEHRVAMLCAGRGAPRIGLTLAQVNCAPGAFRSYEELSTAASAVKEELKRRS